MSRMDRYNKESANSRSSKNKDLYKDIYEFGEYSNIEGIATIEKSNEVDITKVKEMLKNREEYQRQKEIRKMSKKEIDVPTYEVYEMDDDEKVYDIRDILENAKINNPTHEEHQSLKNINYEILKELKEKHFNKQMKEDVVEAVDNISNTSRLNKLSDNELGLDMFDELKSQNDTMVQDKTAIRKLLEEAKEETKKENTNTGIDKSFFTSSLNFGKDDFDEVQELTKSVKKNSLIVKILIFVAILIVVGIIVFFVLNKVK